MVVRRPEVIYKKFLSKEYEKGNEFQAAPWTCFKEIQRISKKFQSCIKVSGIIWRVISQSALKQPETS